MNILKRRVKLKMNVFWDAAQSSLKEFYTRISEVLTASIIRAMMEVWMAMSSNHYPDDGGSRHLSNPCTILPYYKAQLPSRQSNSHSPLHRQ
jgi:hypothetical protein